MNTLLVVISQIASGYLRNLECDQPVLLMIP